ncbi:MAG TPA: zinc ribbon domain-containing protein [Streptosporangiaceae bacterium]|jgi:hypothetical protein
MSTSCRNCGLSLSTDDAFCGNCGQPAAAAPPPSGTAGQGPDTELATPAAAGTDPVPAGRAAADTTRLPAVPPAAAVPAPAASRPVPTAPAAVPAWARAARVQGPREAADQQAAGDAGPGLPRDPAPAVPAAADLPAGARQGFVSVVGEPTFDPLRNKRFIGQIFRRLLLFTLSGLMAAFVILIVGLLFLLLGAFGVLEFEQVMGLIVAIAITLAFALMPVPAMLAYDSKLVSYQAPAAARSFECIKEALDRHATPRDTLTERVLSLPGEGRRTYLELRRGNFAGYICCFPQGRDLYMSWTFWIYMSPLRLIVMFIGRLLQSLGGRGNDMYQTLRYESVRAIVGAVQTCALEGIEVALQEAEGEPFSLAGSLSVPIS